MKKKEIKAMVSFQNFYSNGLSKKESEKIKGGKTDSIIIGDGSAF